MRKKMIAGNWKMNMKQQEGTILISEVVNMVKDEVKSNTLVVLCPPFPHLGYAKKMLQSQANVFIGSQNCADKASGAYTGEVSASILKSFEVDYVIIGHSERREYYKESDATLAEKVNLTLANEMLPIFCCGETLQQRQAGQHFKLIQDQLTNGLFHLSADQFSKVTIAYEPIWAIGTGVTASNDQAQEMHDLIRKHLAQKYGQAAADNTTILYGGSVKADNAAELFACPDVDGGLVGGASLKSREFVNIVKAMK
jgi:triosephosphate isomerase (TIM)